MDYKRYTHIGLITSPISLANRNQLANLASILYSISDSIFFITGNAGTNIFENDKKVHLYPVKYTIQKNTFLKIVAYMLLQFRISWKFLKIKDNAEVWIFFHGSGTLLIPILTAKLFRKKVILMLPGSSKALKYAKDPFYMVVKTLECINLLLADKIIIYSNILIGEWGLEKYHYKISIAHEHFLDFSTFSLTSEYKERQNLIGYVGRLSEEKGILNLIKAIPEIIKWNNNIKFLIIGDGKLRNEIEAYLIENDILDYVIFSGWVPHDELPKYFNQMKLMILPSYSEGLPNVILEAMACGTPVLATSVGAVPDFVKDGKTGFIIETNSPESIFRNITRAMESPILNEISTNTVLKVRSEFSYDSAVKNYERVLYSCY
ncbi:glycosyltransferase family 1 protein [Methanosarcina sp. MSH10X1]|uniref:glycosyltransferase family 4 protein n=1 Tax=Methanosarcina sp. MSH10X1 TaxID=2507075 RepID=UPI000FFB0B7F|nr:glycosyltransferase family 4 protein [Methanosarcina sp. MSH10X1]RXA19725.1 glycosyltransferase family 1 protein [Methanosarcina sp. MSH10X1]